MARRKTAPAVHDPLTSATVCIAGMHRSGTSMLARLLMDGGLYLGDEDELMPAAVDNPEGFYERTDFVFLNDALLAELGGAWDLPPVPPQSWTSERFAPFHQTARTLVTRFADTSRWGWKDPRNSLTVPFWRETLGDLATVFVIRNPLEVALSLQKRNHFSLALGLHLWYAYNRTLHDATAPENRVITHFDAYFGDPDHEIERVLTMLGLPFSPDDLPRLRQNAASGMKHHQVSIGEMQAANVAPEIVSLYVDLCEEAGHTVALGGRGRIQIPTSSIRRETFAPGFLGNGVSRVDLWLYDLEQRNSALNAALAVHEQSRTELDGKIAERDGMILEREGRIADRDMKLLERNRTVNRLSQEVAQLQQTVTDQTAHIEQIEQRLASADEHEALLRQQLVEAHERIMLMDTEVMSTLGGVLARFAPGAPAAIYYRHVLDGVRNAVSTLIPAQALTLVATYGDPEYLELGRRTYEFPEAVGGVAADYTTVSSDEAIAQLERLRGMGAAYLVIPSPAQTWLSRNPRLERHLAARYETLMDEQGMCTIYDLGGPEGDAVEEAAASSRSEG